MPSTANGYFSDEDDKTYAPSDIPCVYKIIWDVQKPRHCSQRVVEIVVPAQCGDLSALTVWAACSAERMIPQHTHFER